MNSTTRQKWLRRKRRIEKRLKARKFRARSRPMFAARNIAHEIADRTRAIGHGGIGSIHLLARRVGLIQTLDRELQLLKVHLPYHESDHVLNIAYWYLRLNGFFPLSRFVLHRDDQRPYNTDCDLLALRFPHVSEPVGGGGDDWDAELFRLFGCNLIEQRQTMVLIVQCKGGASNNLQDVKDCFANDRIAYALRRTGVVPDEDAIALAEGLQSEASVEQGDIVFGKLLIIERPSNRRQENSWRELSIEHVVNFLCKRMRDCRDEKRNAWDKFPSDLLQFLIWHHPTARAADQ